MLPATLEEIRVPTAGRPRLRSERVLADKGYPLKPTGPGCGSGRSPQRSPSATTRSPTAARSPAGPSTSAPNSVNATGVATS
jgi:hypothetical protein